MYTQTYIFGSGTQKIGLPGRGARLRVAGGLLVFLGVGHSALLAASDAQIPRGWLRRGLVGTVDIGVGERRPAAVDVMEDRLHFWAGVGSFAAPTAMLGLLTWRAAGRDEPLPRWLGPALMSWSGLAGTVMTRAPWPLAVVAGVLITTAAGVRGGGTSLVTVRRVPRAQARCAE